MVARVAAASEKRSDIALLTHVRPGGGMGKDACFCASMGDSGLSIFTAAADMVQTEVRDQVLGFLGETTKANAVTDGVDLVLGTTLVVDLRPHKAPKRTEFTGSHNGGGGGQDDTRADVVNTTNNDSSRNPQQGCVSGQSKTPPHYLAVPVLPGKRANAANHWTHNVFPKVLTAVWSLYAAARVMEQGDTSARHRPLVCVVVEPAQLDFAVVAVTAICLAFWDLDLTNFDGPLASDKSVFCFSKAEVRERLASIQDFHKQAALPKRLVKELSNYFGEYGEWRQWWDQAGGRMEAFERSKGATQSQ